MPHKDNGKEKGGARICARLVRLKMSKIGRGQKNNDDCCEKMKQEGDDDMLRRRALLLRGYGEITSWHLPATIAERRQAVLAR